MERESQSTRTGLIEALSPQAPYLNFYRFCQLLEQADKDAPLLGTTSHPGTDPVRFRPHPGMGFPVSEIKSIDADKDHPDAPPTVRTTFMGLYGVDSPLPTGYLDDIAQRREGHEGIEHFLDIFNHRLMTQFYRIWRKYAYPATFQAGGTDETSQCLLGLIGLGIPGTEKHIATPVSRFLALLSTMRLPTRTAEGIRALVNLLAPQTQAHIQGHDPVSVEIRTRSGLSGENKIALAQRSVLGRKGKDGNSRVLVTLFTDNAQEAEGWLPGGHLHTDLLVLMRVYLGYRCNARLQLTVPTRLLPEPRLGGTRRIQLGRTGVLGLQESKRSSLPQSMTVSLGLYEGVRDEPLSPATSGEYRFS